VSPVVLYKIAVDVEHERDDPSYYTAKSFRNLKSLIKKASKMYAKGQGNLSLPNPVNPNLMEEVSDDEDNDATTEHSSSLHFMPTVFQNSVSWIIFRRYNNFRKLYKQLLKLSLMAQYTEEYAALCAVPLPKKRLFGNLEEKVIHSRMFALNKMLSVICEYYNLFKSEPAQHFILPNNDKLYLKDITIDALFSQHMLVQQQEYMQNKQIQLQKEQKLTVKASDFKSELMSAINESIIQPEEPNHPLSVVSNENVEAIPLSPEELQRKMIEDQNNQILFEQWLKRVCRCEICEKDHAPQDMISIDTCMHNFCYDCMKTYIDSKLHDQNVSILDFQCPASQCESQIPYSVIKSLSTQHHENAGVSEIDRLIEDTFQKAIETSEGIIRCPNKNCKFRMERVKYDLKSPEYQLEITKRSLELQGVLQNIGLDVMMEIIGCELDNRFRCRACGTEFCAQCNAMPYHHKYTCKQRKSQKCRFCGSSEQLSPMPVDDTTVKYRDLVASRETSGVAFVCTKDECQLKCSRSCKKILPCGHYCGGVDKETTCLPCLNENCISQTTNNNTDQEPKQNADDLCNMCWVEDLGSAPCLQLECGHIFHHECIMNTLDKRWPGPRITFGFMNCPLCKKPMSHPMLQSVLEPILEYRKEVEFRTLDRLKYEGLQGDPRIESKYNNSALDFAMDTLSYFECYKCKKPYFGGLKACNDGLDRAFDERELVCAGCSGSNLVQSCPKHGTAFIEFKCKFCCSVGTWFCWGTTHFCDSCHNLQLQHNYLNLKKEDEFPRCKGRDYCPLKVDHPHFQEFCLGCSVCKYVHEKM